VPRLPRPGRGDLQIAAGVGIVLIGGVMWLAPVYDAAHWRDSPEAVRAQRNADAPQPVWVTPRPAATLGVRSRAAAPTFVPTARPDTSVPLPPGPTLVATPGPEVVLPLAAPTPSTSDLWLTAAQFQFLDPPEPGAHARLTLAIHNPTDQPAGPVSLALPMTWLAGYRVEALNPPPVDGLQTNGALRLTFDGPDVNADVDLAVDVVAIDEVIDAPLLTVLDADGREVGHLQPATEAPPARPGPIYSIDIPHIRLHTGVVPVEWEPPLFVIGQLRASAYVTEGNSVLVGHVRGAPGYNVFDRLEQLAPGDQIIARSRGEAYTFVVTETTVLPQDDTSPTVSTVTPRLTLMTCTGTFNPLTRDYPDRLWVIAEPTGATAESVAARKTASPAELSPVIRLR
jgi:LPXTG-site transpeptidase (sortase) family protein